MNESKLPHAIFGTVLSWWLTLVSQVGQNAGMIAALLAGLASVATIWAAVETALWRRRQRRKP